MKLKVEEDEKQSTELVDSNEGNVESLEDELITDKVKMMKLEIKSCRL